MKLLLVISVLALSGCGVLGPHTRNESLMSSLALGDSRETVVSKIGQPDSIKLAKSDGDKSVQFDEYVLLKKNARVINAVGGVFVLTVPWWVAKNGMSTRPYLVKYIDGKLTGFGENIQEDKTLYADVTVRQR